MNDDYETTPTRKTATSTLGFQTREQALRERDEALARCSSLSASLEASDRREQRYREALEAIVQSRQEAWSWSAARLRTIAARGLLVEHDSLSETTTGAAVDASNTVALVVHKDDGRTITYEVRRERIRTEHDEEETP